MGVPRPIDHASAEYAGLYQRSAVRTPFADPRFIASVADALSLRPNSVVLNGHAVTAWSRTVGPLSLETHPAVCYYSSVCLASDSPALPDLRALGAHAGAPRIQLPPGVSMADVAAQQDVATFQTYLLSPDDLGPENWSASRRRLYGKHRDAFGIGSATAADVVRHASAAYERHGRRPPFEPKRTTVLLDRLQANGLAELHAARTDGETVAAAAFLVDDRRGYYWLAGSEPGPSMTVLLGSVFSSLADRGLGLDFLGANTSSIAEFKRRFGGDLASHLHVGIQPSGMLGRLRRILRRR